MTGVVKVKGIPMLLGGTEYVVPPLALGALEQFQDRINSFTGDVSDLKQVGAVIDIAHAALKRNYPELPRETVANDLIDVGNMIEIFEAVMDVSGLKRKAKEQAAGEAAAGNSAGTTSTAT